MINPLSEARPYVKDDGVFTLELILWIVALVEEVNSLRASVDDHEARITALEP